ncbi:hypothetical protein EMCRGX_G016008 [Ephydatia muelleri]
MTPRKLRSPLLLVAGDVILQDIFYHKKLRRVQGRSRKKKASRDSYGRSRKKASVRDSYKPIPTLYATATSRSRRRPLYAQLPSRSLVRSSRGSGSSAIPRPLPQLTVPKGLCHSPCRPQIAARSLLQRFGPGALLRQQSRRRGAAAASFGAAARQESSGTCC